jgi:serine protease Do
MKRTISLLLASLLVCGTLSQAAAPVRTLADLQALQEKAAHVADKVTPTTVALISERTGSSGSGVVITEDGLVLTAAHVIQGADEILVVFPDGKQVPGKVLGANFSKDIAMVKITEPGKYPFSLRGESKGLKAGDWVIAFGHSAGFDPTRTPPMRFGRVISKGPGNFLTTDCTLIGGDSGGPLFDLDGRVIAVHSSIGTSFQNNNHAGIDGFREDWDRLLAGKMWGQLMMNPFANPDSPVLGIDMGATDDDSGVKVRDVTPGSPASRALLKPGDIIRLIDGSQVADSKDLLRLIAKKQPDDVIRLGVFRDQGMLEIPVKLARRSELGDNNRRQLGGMLLQLQLSGDIPLRSREEKEEVDRQTEEIFKTASPLEQAAARSTVWVYQGNRQTALGTVIGDGNEVLTKWSETATAPGRLTVVTSDGSAHSATIRGVYEKEDLAVLKLEESTHLTPVKWSSAEEPRVGHLLVAALPAPDPAGFGVVSVAARNLRETDQAYLGVLADPTFEGAGARVGQIEPNSGAKRAGLQSGDVIVAIDGRKVSGVMEMRNALLGRMPDETVRIAYARGGREAIAEVMLGHRPQLQKFPNQRMEQMEVLGGKISQVRDGFSHVIQTDMALEPEKMGGPVTDLKGDAVGLVIARADRTKSFVIPAATIGSLLKTPPTDPSVAARNMASAMPFRREIPQMDAPQMDDETAQRIRGQLGQMRQMMLRMQEEMEQLNGR